MDAFVPEVAPPPLLECRDLTKRYGATVALDRFTVSLPAGRIVGLLGPNGSGKTTLLKMIAGVADNGELVIHDPNSPANSARTWDAERVLAQCANLWAFERG